MGAIEWDCAFRDNQPGADADAAKNVASDATNCCRPGFRDRRNRDLCLVAHEPDLGHGDRIEGLRNIEISCLTRNLACITEKNTFSKEALARSSGQYNALRRSKYAISI